VPCRTLNAVPCRATVHIGFESLRLKLTISFVCNTTIHNPLEEHTLRVKMLSPLRPSSGPLIQVKLQQALHFLYPSTSPNEATSPTLDPVIRGEVTLSLPKRKELRELVVRLVGICEMQIDGREYLIARAVSCFGRGPERIDLLVDLLILFYFQRWLGAI
jgi:hypothetical protein